jgi:hypothetical protein
MTTSTGSNSYRRTASFVGLLFLIAMVTSLGGGLWVESILDAPDYLVAVSANSSQVVIGALLEIINCITVIGIAVLLYPILKKKSSSLGLGYVGFRIMEAAILVAAVVCSLLLITLSNEYLAAGTGDTAYFQSLGILIKAARSNLTGVLTATFFSCAALLLYYFLYQTKLVPRFISIWGLIAVLLMLTWNLLEAFGISISAGIIFGLLIILNEIFLGIWLIAKGFNLVEFNSDLA